MASNPYPRHACLPARLLVFIPTPLACLYHVSPRYVTRQLVVRGNYLAYGPCLKDDCQNGGMCDNTGITCDCPLGYFGAYCQFQGDAGVPVEPGASTTTIPATTAYQYYPDNITAAEPSSSSPANGAPRNSDNDSSLPTPSSLDDSYPGAHCPATMSIIELARVDNVACITDIPVVTAVGQSFNTTAPGRLDSVQFWIAPNRIFNSTYFVQMYRLGVDGRADKSTLLGETAQVLVQDTRSSGLLAEGKMYVYVFVSVFVHGHVRACVCDGVYQ